MSRRFIGLVSGGGGAGTVTSVSGTANQIDVATGTTTPVISLDPAITLPGTINKLTLTAPATGATLTIADGKTLTASNTVTLSGTDGASLNISNAVVASSPGVGLAHFAGSTQTVTSSAVALATADVSGVLPIANGGSGAATFAGNKWFGNNTSSTVAPAASSIGSSDTSVNWYAVDTGAVNAYVVSPTPALVALTTGASVFFKVLNAPTGASTINVSSLGVKNLMKQTTAGVAALGTAGDMNTSGIYQAIYDGTEWVLQNPSSMVSTSGALGALGIITGNSANQIQGTALIKLDATKAFFATYNSETTAGLGAPYVRGVTSQKSETTTADANVLTVTPAAAVGTYRVNVVISVSAATSGVIGWTLSWTDSNGNAQSNIAQSLFQLGTASPALTFTTSAAGNYSGSTVIDVNNAAAGIIVKWVGGGTTTAKMSAVIERLQ